MKSTVAFSQLLMLSTSLLCLSSFAEQTPSLESKETDNSEHLMVNTLAEQSGKVKRAQEMPRTTNTQNVRSCKTADNPHRFDVKHIEAKGIGYNQGYTSLDAFFTGNVCNFIPFIDLRAHVFNNGKWASNAGIGTRYVLDPCKSMVGVNAYYDYRSTKHFHYNQVGAGIEAYYDRFEFLANGYLPVGSKRTRTSHELDSIDFKRFSGNYILYNKYYKNKYEGAMKGFNAEVGTHFAGDMKNYDLYFGIGPYYYDLHKGEHSWGGKARLKMEFTRFLFVEVSDSWDHIFHNRFQGSVTLSVPFGVKKCYGKKRLPNNRTQNCSNVMDWLATLPVDRQEIIVVDKFSKKQTIDPVAIDPATGKPFFVVFVDNNNSNTGVGTFENPFSYLSALDNPGTNAQQGSFPDNTIYVFQGDGTNARMATGMVLQEKQRMLGSGMAHTYVTTDGVLVIPAQSAKAPFITGTIAVTDIPAVLINVNNCEVSGFKIGMQTAFPAGTQTLSATNGSCISVASDALPLNASVTNVTLTNNEIVNETNGINLGTVPLTFVEGNIIVTDNIISMHRGSTTQLGVGINIPSCRNANLLIENNQVTFNPIGTVMGSLDTVGIAIRIYDQVYSSILNNKVNNMSGTGMIMRWEGAAMSTAGFTGTAIIKNNLIENVGGSGFRLFSSSPATVPGSIKVIMEDNTVVAQGIDTFFTVADPGMVSNPGLLVRFRRNTIPGVTFNTGTALNAQLWVEPTVGNNCTFTVTGTEAIIPIVPCQYGGPDCP
jgi:hypothetical protein